MSNIDIDHACSTYGISIQGEITMVDDHWEFMGILYREAESTPKLFRADRQDTGGFRIRQIRKRQPEQ